MFSKRLKAARIEAGLSQKALAAKLFVSQQAVGKWEVDQGSPNPEAIAKMAEIFGVSADYLLGLTDQKEKPAPVDRDGLAEKKRMVYERLDKLDSRNIEIAIGQLDVLLNLQEKQDKD